MQLLIRALENENRVLATVKGTAIEQRRNKKLIDRLYQVSW